MLTTAACKLGKEPARYALEGSVAITGALVQWLRDNLGLIRISEAVENLARTVEDNGGVYFVPAFSGLYALHWKVSARGVIAGAAFILGRRSLIHLPTVSIAVLTLRLLSFKKIPEPLLILAAGAAGLPHFKG